MNEERRKVFKELREGVEEILSRLRREGKIETSDTDTFAESGCINIKIKYKAR